MGRWLDSVGMLNHGINYNLGPAKVFSPAIFENISLVIKIYGLLPLIVICAST